ncbi:hypothetical protein C3495_05960 [Clostridiaceae bacterium 14S0207]|nr:hypothetical protein C3495_05960 [Clostridiaceae bacterium 14S0207]
MDIINIKSLKIINEENQKLKQEKIAQVKILSDVMLEIKKKDKFNMQLARTVSELNLKLNKLEKEGR